MLRGSMKKRLQFFDYLSDEIVLRLYIFCEAEDVRHFIFYNNLQMVRLGLCNKRLLALTHDRYAWEGRVENSAVDVCSCIANIKVSG